MKLHSLFAALVAAALPMSAFAADGSISFEGKVEGTTCAVTGGNGTTPGADAANFKVVLPTVSTSALAAKDAFAGSTPFEIKVGPGGGSGATACDVNKVKTVMFELSQNTNNVDATTGNLKNTAATTPAANVQIGLLNGNSLAKINLATATAADYPAFDKTAGVVKYVAQYWATGAASGGNVESKLIYSVVYN